MPRIVKFSERILEHLGALIQRGGIIVYPTDTVYGLGCDPMNEEAVERVYEIKLRERKPMPILADSVESASRAGLLDEKALQIAYRAWPGQLTIVVEASPRLRRSPLASEEGKVGIRIPASIQTLKILKASRGLLVGTSANISGEPPPKSLRDLDKRIAERVDLVIDGGRCLVGEPSTVIEILRREVRVLREGALKIERLKALIEDLGLTLRV